ncbi:MAG TPA: hypothetical protein VGQ41_05365 [Pyrinomonadaceae bacterium]|jgi:hypothetical protein|nr:hypothetical protein [Pyrinomonadaceae bacterium]
MLTRNQALLCTLLICFEASAVLAQSSSAEFQKALSEKAAFDETDFATLQLNQAVVRSIPTSDKAEIAVSGLVNIRAVAEEFLRSYRDSMTRKSNTAILEIGAFGLEPSPADLETLTLETRDIEDLKECVVGECQVKLSAAMIERFRKEINWDAADYESKVTSLFRQMLFEYVKDYRTRGEAALIEYSDKRDQVSLADEQRTLNAAPSYVNQFINGSKAGLELLEDALVWSKIKFGLKPVIAINHILIYKRNSDVGPQVLIASEQIYANHYFNASLALTAFVRVPDAPNGAYLVYENRSRADGLEGPFGKLKRGVVEKKAVEGLRSILEHSKARLEGSTIAASTDELASYQSNGWGQRLFGGVRPLLWLLVLSALIALLALGRRRTESSRTSKSKALKPESAKS